MAEVEFPRSPPFPGIDVVDAVVLGGGPAGSAAARILAQQGHGVVLLPGSPPPRRVPAESLPPSIRKPLQALGLLSPVEAAEFLPCRGNVVAWGTPRAERRDFAPGEIGWQVDRERWDALLLQGARSAGARIPPGARAVEVESGAGGRERWRIRWAGPDGASGELRTPWVLDATGRTGILARRGFRRPHDGPASTALLTVWHRPGGWPEDEGGHTVVESYREGWGWSVPLPGDRRLVGCVVERRSGGRRGGGSPLPALFREEVERTRHLRRIVEGALPASAPSACPATPYDAVRYADPGLLLVGDAGSFLDPLSSFGVKKALASGWLAGVAVHTALRTPAMEEHALALFDQRERAAHAGHRSGALLQYGEGAAAHHHPFWTRRAAGPSRTSPAPGTPVGGDEPPADASMLAGDPRVHRAFSELRNAREGRLRPAPGLRRVARPTVRGEEVVLEDHVASPALPGGIRYFRAVDLSHLVQLAAHHPEVPSLYEAYQGRTNHDPVPLPDFLGALSTLLGLGMLEHCAST
jgi:flavin-dependent dehydrogenase